MESDDLLFPIEEVVDNTSVENIKSESGNIMNHAIYVHLCSILLYQKKRFLSHGTAIYSDRVNKSHNEKMMAPK